MWTQKKTNDNAITQRNHNRIMALTDKDSIFYANDGLITGTNQAAVQFCIDLVTNLFSLFGLKMNANKSKGLVGLGLPPTAFPPPSSTDDYPVRATPMRPTSAT
jgi:hypothetical protein